MSGVTATGLQLLLLPLLLRKYSPRTVYNALICFWPLTFLTFPILNLIARIGFDNSTGHVLPEYLMVIWAAIFLTMMFARLGSLAFAYV